MNNSENRILGPLLRSLGPLFAQNWVPFRLWNSEMAIFGHRQSQHKNDVSGCEVQCSTMFNRCSTHLWLLGLHMAKYGHLGHKRPFSGTSGAPKWCFRVVKKAQTDPLGCEVQCSTLFNQCSTHLRLLGLHMAKNSHFGPKKAVFGDFWRPKKMFPGGLNGPNWPPWMWSTMFKQV